MAIARTTAMMAMISSMERSPFQSDELACERQQRAQALIAQPQAAPHHHAEIETEQNVGEQRASDSHMRSHRAAEIAGHQDRSDERGRRESVKRRAHQADRAKASREAFARSIAHPVHRLRDNWPRHELDRAI